MLQRYLHNTRNLYSIACASLTIKKSDQQSISILRFEIFYAAVLLVWLSIIDALGKRLRPDFIRTFSRKTRFISSKVPSRPSG